MKMNINEQRRRAKSHQSAPAVSTTPTVALVALICVSLLLVVFVVGRLVVAHLPAPERLVRLLCETDYRALLEGCRELSARMRRGSLQAGTYGVRDNPATQAASFPQVILDVQPGYVVIENDGRVFLEMFGTGGVVAYPEGCAVSPYDPGDVELIPSLWYYDEGYDKYADYKARIDALVEKGKRYNEAKRATDNPRSR